MEIESRIKREGGSDIDIDGVVYKFRPNEKGEHVCEVDNETHAQRLISIVEGYKIPGAADPEPVNDVPEITNIADGPSVALDDAAVKSYLVDELGIENPEDESELREYCEAVLGIDAPEQGAEVILIARFIIDNQPDPDSDEDDDDKEMTEVEVLAYVVDVFGIENPTDKDALQAYAEESLKIKVPKTMKPMNMAIKMIEIHKQQDDSAE